MKSLQKVLDIIDTIAELGSAGIRELSSITGYPPATIHRIASTLIKRRYLTQDPVTKTYALSLRFLELGTRVREGFNLASIARPHLERLMAKTKENANLAVRDGDEVVYLDHVRGNHMLQLFTRLGARVPLYTTGVGKMFLSQWSESELSEYFERVDLKPHTPNTLVDKDMLLKELSQVRYRGFAVDNEEMEEGVRCVAALVYDHNQRPAAAVSISGASVRITPDKIAALGEEVKGCALAISRALGFHLPAEEQRKEVGHHA